ncbi:hypothetical protein [Agrococcus jenensis]|uniref:Uncharacterized protein n=1 Tax=Agrococcus jenensis TaxID=46353 RepID=A0A3N2ASM8_9MICO|nr:hypothetical protein [Agrococcus jenensis]ROR65752.1 hypothetical protein EDD26_1122 [Agrococcus jenensis]
MGERAGLAVLERLSPGLEATRGRGLDTRGSAVLLDQRVESGLDTRGFAVLLDQRGGTRGFAVLLDPRVGTGLLDQRVGAEV